MALLPRPKREESKTQGVSALVILWGMPGDIPVAKDFDGDHRTDIVVGRPSTGQWFAKDVIPAFR